VSNREERVTSVCRILWFCRKWWERYAYDV